MSAAAATPPVTSASSSSSFSSTEREFASLLVPNTASPAQPLRSSQRQWRTKRSGSGDRSGRKGVTTGASTPSMRFTALWIAMGPALSASRAHGPRAPGARIYSRPMAPSLAQSIDDLRRMAERRLPRAMFDFIDGGAEDELTLRANREAFERLRLRPRVLVDVSRPDTAAELLGAQAPLPLAVSPTGMSGVAWPKAELEIARAAAKRGIPYTLATPATTSIEQLAPQVCDKLGGRP